MKKILGFLALATVLFSCSNEVDLTADYKDITIVYGLLNQNDSAHYIRIQKAFLVNGNALDYAKVPDSIQYNIGDLDVKLEERKDDADSTLIKTIQLSAVTDVSKDTGSFATIPNVLYKTSEKLNSKYIYKLIVTNTKTGKIITGSTRLIYYSSEFFKTPGAGSVNWNTPNGSGYTIRWFAANNGIVYQPEVVFYFREVNVLLGDTIRDSLVWTFVSQERDANASAGDLMELNLPQNSFYQFVADKLEPKENVKRYADWLNFKCYVGTDDLNTYINVNKPSIGLIQEKPVFTNLTNALGVFTGRTTFIKKLVPLSQQSKDTLVFGKYTQGLGFQQ